MAILLWHASTLRMRLKGSFVIGDFGSIVPTAKAIIGITIIEAIIEAMKVINVTPPE